MGYNMYWIFVVMLLAGCATDTSKERMYEQGYREGVREQVKTIAAQFKGGQFPYYQWQQPLVQEVEVPAHIQGGVFIPAQKQMVIIKPGQWVHEFSYPIASSKDKGVEHETNDSHCMGVVMDEHGNTSQCP